MLKLLDQLASSDKKKQVHVANFNLKKNDSGDIEIS